MKRARYRLEAMLKVKLRDKKRAEIALAQALNALNEARKKFEELQSAKKKLREEQKTARRKMDLEMSGGGRIGQGCFHVNFLRKLKEDEKQKDEEIEDQQEIIKDAQEKVARTRKAYIHACHQLQIMEKHKDLWRKKIRREISRHEEKEMDELGQTIHSLKKWRGERSVFEI